MKKIIIAIDGFSSCGKSTMAKDFAKEIGYIYIDSGAMYRAVTLYCMENNLFNNQKVDIDTLKSRISNINISFQINQTDKHLNTYLDGVNIEEKIRTMEVSAKVSIISKIDFVRNAMVAQQQAMGVQKGIVMDGRDIGTVVFPKAELKIFVTADVNIRAQRRYKEFIAKGQKPCYEKILENVIERDRIDQNREISPLRKAEDAILLDNSTMSISEQKDWLLKKFHAIVDN